MFAILSGCAFLLSWLWQVYISKKADKSKVDFVFWGLRFLGVIFLGIHAIHRQDWALLLMNTMGLSVYAYNIFLVKKNDK